VTGTPHHTKDGKKGGGEIASASWFRKNLKKRVDFSMQHQFLRENNKEGTHKKCVDAT